MSCSCDKNGYSKKEAQTKVNEREGHGKCKKGSLRIYECLVCGYWHITSKEKRSTMPKPLKLKYVKQFFKLMR